MKLKTKKILASGATVLLWSLPSLAFGQYWPDRGIGGSGLYDTPVVDIIETVMLWLLLIFTYIAVIGFVISGIMYITAGGSGRAEEAKKWMVYSIIGTAVGISGYVIIRLISDTVEGVVN
jgi:hypothetical protein